MLTFGSLFAGIGGIDLGLERAGMRCVWQVENDDYARSILQKHWPTVPRYRDVRYFLSGKRWRSRRAAWHADLVCGGFPCQDISNAGRRAGITGSRSGLWSEFARIVRLLRPAYVLVENVPALTLRGLSRVLGDLAALGFDAEWDCIPAAAVGAPHLRWRVFIFAHAAQSRMREVSAGVGGAGDAADPHGNRRKPRRTVNAKEGAARRKSDRGTVGDDVPDTDSERREKQYIPAVSERQGQPDRTPVPDAASRWAGQRWRDEFAAYSQGQRGLFWPDAEPDIRGSLDGFSAWLDGFGGILESHKRIVNYVIHSGGLQDGNAEKTGPRQVLQALQCLNEEALQREWSAGISFRLSPTEVSLAYLRKLQEVGVEQGGLSLPGAEADWAYVRGVWLEEESARAPRRRQRGKQRPIQHTDALQALSWTVAQDSGTAWSAFRRENAEALARLNVGGLDGVRPIAGGAPNRAHRLRGLGNAVVPQVAEWIGRRILEVEAKLCN